MALQIPVAVNYPSPLAYVPSRMLTKPSEGNKFFSLEIDWGLMGGAAKCVAVNLSNNAPLNFRQIIAVKYDNSACGSDVQLIFPDSSDTVTFPAYAQAIVPVFTNGQVFYISSPTSQAEDVTRLQVLNFLPPPVDLSRSAFVEMTATGTIAIGSGTTAIIPTVSGTLEYLQIGASYVEGGSAADNLVTITDGASDNIGTFVIHAGASQNFSGLLWSSPPISIRFSTGLDITQVVTGTGPMTGSLYYNAYYRVP